MAKNKTKKVREAWMERHGRMRCRGTRVVNEGDVGFVNDCGADLRETIWEAIPEDGGEFSYECPGCGREGHGTHYWPEEEDEAA